MKSKINNVIRIPTSLEGFFNYWFIFLRPFHNLTNKEIEVAAAFARKRFSLSQVILSEELIDKTLLSEDTKKEIREELNMSLPHFQVILGKLRKAQIIQDNKFNPKFLPNMSQGDECCQLLLYFTLK